MDDPALIAGVARIVVVADYLFTATAMVVQPLTGFALAWRAGYPLSEHWIMLSLLLYGVVAAFWLMIVRPGRLW